MQKILLAILITLAGNLLLAQTYPVVWQELNRVTVNSDNSLTKTQASGSYNAGAAGQNMILSGQDGYIQFTYATGSNYGVGLSRMNNSPTLTSMDYALQFNGTSLNVYQLTTLLSSTTVAAGDVMKIAREGNAIKYYKNTTLLKTVILTDNSYNLRVDAAIYSGSVPPVVTSFRPALVVKPAFQFPDHTNTGGSIGLSLEGNYDPVTYSWSSGETTSSITNKPRGSYTVTVTDAQSRSVTKTFNPGYPVVWSNLVNVSLNPNGSLLKTNSTSQWDASASSLNVLPANTDGWIEFVLTDAQPSVAIGLMRIDRVEPEYSLESQYLWRLSATSGSAVIWESDVSIGAFGSIVKGDVFRIARIGSDIKYYINGTEVRSVATTASIPYVIMAGLSDAVADLPVVTCSFEQSIRVTANPTFPDAATNQGGGFTPTIQGAYEPYTVLWSSGETTANITNRSRGIYTLTITDAASRVFTRSYYLGYPAKWTDLQNATLQPDNTLTCSGSSWAGAAITANILLPNTDGWVEFEFDRLPGNIMMGLARLNAVANYPSIDFAFYVSSAKALPGDLAIRELGTNKLSAGVLAEGEVFRIAREGSYIKYYRNGVEIRSVATNPSYSLVVDFSATTAEVPKVSTSFTNIARTFYAIKTSNWTDLTAWSLTEGGTAAQLYPCRGDVAYIKGYTISVLTGIYCSDIHVAATNPTTVLKVDGTAASLNVSGKVYVKGDGTTTPVKSLVVQNSAKLNVVNGE